MMENGWKLSYKAQLGDSHPTGAGIDWLELSRPSHFFSETAACTVSSGCPGGEGIALTVREALGISEVIYHVPYSQRQATLHPRSQVTLQ